MTETATGIVDVETSLWIIAPDGQHIPIRGTFIYNRDDPHAVQFHIINPDGTRVLWVFGRELVYTGRTEPTGELNVRIAPWSGEPSFTAIVLISPPEDQALLKIPTSILDTFLTKAYGVVPRGQEFGIIDVAAAFEQLLAGTSHQPTNPQYYWDKFPLRPHPGHRPGHPSRHPGHPGRHRREQ
jgi:hypothetical protein